jgi:hypothetical protein
MTEPVVNSDADTFLIPTEIFRHVVFNMIIDYVEWEIPTPDLFPAFLIGRAQTTAGLAEVAISSESFRDRKGTIDGEKIRDCIGPDVQRFRPAAALVITGNSVAPDEPDLVAPGILVFFIDPEDVDVFYRDVVRDGEQWSLGPEDWRAVGLTPTLEAVVAPILGVVRAR